MDEIDSSIDLFVGTLGMTLIERKPSPDFAGELAIIATRFGVDDESESRKNRVSMFYFRIKKERKSFDRINRCQGFKP